MTSKNARSSRSDDVEPRPSTWGPWVVVVLGLVLWMSAWLLLGIKLLDRPTRDPPIRESPRR